MGYVRHPSRLSHKASRSLSRLHRVGGPGAGFTLLSCTTDKLLAITCTHACTNRLITVIIVVIIVTVIVIIITTMMVIKMLASSW